jgi:hypothetical protein
MGWRLIVKDIQIAKFPIEAHREKACNLGISIYPNKSEIGSIYIESLGLNYPGGGGYAMERGKGLALENRDDSSGEWFFMQEIPGLL